MLNWRSALLAIFGIVSCAGIASANSCGNVDVIGTYDESGMHEGGSQIYAVGTFRIADEADEAKQPMFNLSQIICDQQLDGRGSAVIECKLTQAVVYANDAKPSTGDSANCSLDLDASTYTMAEFQKGILTGMQAAASTTCYNTTLTIDRNAKRVYMSFVRTQYADNYDKIKPGICGATPRTQVLMNCTGWPKLRKNDQQISGRYCDFSGSADK
jgi:hypothetical protein